MEKFAFPLLLLFLFLFSNYCFAVERQYIVNFPPGQNLPPPPINKAIPVVSREPSKESTVELTLPSAVGRAVQGNLSIKAASWGIKIAERDVKAATAARLPVVRINAQAKDSNFGDRWLQLGQIGETLRDINADTAGIAGIGLEVPLYVGGRLPASERLARAGEEAARLRKKTAIQQSIFNTISAYLDVLVKNNAVKLEQKRLAQKKHEIMTAREKATERFALKQQVLALELEANEFRQDELKHHNELLIAKGKLRNELGLTSSTPIDVDARVGLVDLGYDLETLVDRARRNNLQIRLLLTQVRAAKERIGIAAADEKAQVSLAYDYYHTHPFDNPDNDFETWEVKLQGTIKLFDGGRGHQKRIKSIESLRKLEVELSSARQSVELRTREAFARYREAQKRLSSLDDNIRLAREMLRFIRERVKARVLLKDALLKAQVDLLEAQQAKFFVQAMLLKARATLFLLIGELGPSKVAGPSFTSL